jgi:hypothetical protein
LNIPDEIRKCVVFLGYKRQGQFRAAATGFAVAQEEQGMRLGFLVTAQHVVGGLVAKGDDIWIRTNLKSGLCEEQLVPANVWHFHPNSPRGSDVAATMVNEWGESDVHALPINGPQGVVASKEVMNSLQIGLGAEIAIIGLFGSHFGVGHNVPIVRAGNIAAFQDEPIKTKYCGDIDAHLIEARSIGGLSGSPVFLTLPAVRFLRIETGVVGHHRMQTTFTSGQGIFLLGLVHGHFDVPNLNEEAPEGAGTVAGVNSGIGVVVPVEKILETINEPGWAEERRSAIARLREQADPQA